MAEKGWVDRMFYSLEPQFRVLVPFRNTGQIQVPKLICALHVSVAKGVKIELLFLWRGKYNCPSPDSTIRVYYPQNRTHVVLNHSTCINITNIHFPLI